MEITQQYSMHMRPPFTSTDTVYGRS